MLSQALLLLPASTGWWFIIHSTAFVGIGNECCLILGFWIFSRIELLGEFTSRLVSDLLPLLIWGSNKPPLRTGASIIWEVFFRLSLEEPRGIKKVCPLDLWHPWYSEQDPWVISVVSYPYQKVLQARGWSFLQTNFTFPSGVSAFEFP